MLKLIWNSWENKWRGLSVRQKGMLIVGIPISCLAVSLPTVSWSHFDLIEDEDVLARLQLIRSISKDLLQSTADAQWGVQSYVISRHEPFLSNYYEARQYIPRHIENLPQDVATNLTQKAKLLEIERFSEDHLKLMTDILNHARNQDNGQLHPEELSEWLDNSDDSISELHHRIERLAAEEEATLIENRQHLKEHQDRGYAMLSVFVVIGIGASLLAIKLFFNLDRELKNKQLQLEAANARLQISNRQLQRFTANASHQLRSPLAAILSNAQVGLLSTKPEEAAIRQRLNKIVELTKSNSNLVSNLLALARYETMVSPDKLESIELVSLLSLLSDRFEEIIADKKLKFNTLLSQTPVLVLGESDLLAQVVTNLLDNAIKYTPEGGRIQLQLFTQNTSAVIRVIDSGMGIPQNNLDNIFERFYREESAKKSQQKGYGLGLAISREIMRLHKGKITVKSKISEGTTFTLELPLINDT